jgi:hypothetical protein
VLGCLAIKHTRQLTDFLFQTIAGFHPSYPDSSITCIIMHPCEIFKKPDTRIYPSADKED